MYYYKYPKTYNWDDPKEMDPKYGGYEASRLIRDLGAKNALNMDYGCDASGAHTSDIPKVLKKFGYKSASHKKLGEGDYQLIRNQLRHKMPVILAGSKKSDFSFIGIHGDGHAWVCDGFRKIDNCTYSSTTLHMNWGWGYNNKSYNGWYSSDWTPQSDGNKDKSYNEGKELVYNIQP